MLRNAHRRLSGCASRSSLQVFARYCHGASAGGMRAPDTLTPMTLHVEYCETCQYLPRVEKLRFALDLLHPGQFRVRGNVPEVLKQTISRPDARSGAFEVISEDLLLQSRRDATGDAASASTQLPSSSTQLPSASTQLRPSASRDDNNAAPVDTGASPSRPTTGDIAALGACGPPAPTIDAQHACHGPRIDSANASQSPGGSLPPHGNLRQHPGDVALSLPSGGYFARAGNSGTAGGVGARENKSGSGGGGVVTRAKYSKPLTMDDFTLPFMSIVRAASTGSGGHRAGCSCNTTSGSNSGGFSAVSSSISSSGSSTGTCTGSSAGTSTVRSESNHQRTGSSASSSRPWLLYSKLRTTRHLVDDEALLLTWIDCVLLPARDRLRGAERGQVRG